MTVTLSTSTKGNFRIESDIAASPLSLPDMMEQAGTAHRNAAILNALLEASVAAGGHVQLLHDYHFCPILEGSDGQPIPLYQFVEALDGVVDYDLLKEEFPTLSYAQINGAMLFLRKIAQFNSRGVDIDEQEDIDIAGDPALLDALTRAIADEEISRVLNFNERNGGSST